MPLSQLSGIPSEPRTAQSPPARRGSTDLACAQWCGVPHSTVAGVQLGASAGVLGGLLTLLLVGAVVGRVPHKKSRIRVSLP